MGVQVPERATFLRTIWSEMARISSHLLWLGLMADAFGFESLIMQRFRVRERVLDVFEEMTGGRVIFGVCTIGGVRRDVQPAALGTVGPVLRASGIRHDTRLLGYAAYDSVDFEPCVETDGDS